MGQAPIGPDIVAIIQRSSFSPTEAKEEYESVLTCGSWPDEEKSAAAFDTLIGESQLFSMYREVSGTYFLTNPFAEKRAVPRIDRILSPTKKLLDLGWIHGLIGVELKRSGEKIGPALAQLLDYNDALWRLRPGNFCIKLNWLFLWPLDRLHGTWASLMSQKRFGNIYPYPNGNLCFHIGEQTLLYIPRNGSTPHFGLVTSGQKNGSR